ncbi:MAG: bifunctional (p)ppGpp synthetase/guanosine-3',5'-bis(diphosphate) 3'-pyrophosphohydrolase [Candidatus Delongbacteria bacterium]|nr:bifunctional (p)ppGpp synthetase/guanosine-3',5'-bis(diphosphate) 3'-pyrophosphohydrolase [Candidatus Delongbacteria bacterium]
METPLTPQQLLKAAEFAAEKHKHLRRKDIDHIPYINHLIRVARLLAEQVPDADRNLILGALLHDVIEDTTTSPQELANEFGDDVAELVMEVTDDKSQPKYRRKQLQIDRAPHKSRNARLIKLADKISNLSDLIIAPPEKWSVDECKEYAAWANQVIDRIRGTHAGLEHLFDETLKEFYHAMEPK